MMQQQKECSMFFSGTTKTPSANKLQAEVGTPPESNASSMPRQTLANFLLEDMILKKIIPDSSRQLYKTGEFTRQVSKEQRRQIIGFAQSITEDLDSGFLSHKTAIQIMWCFRIAIVNHLGEPDMFKFLAQTLLFDAWMQDKPEGERALPGLLHVLMFSGYLPPLDELHCSRLKK